MRVYKTNQPEDFWARVSIGSADECWEWQGSRNTVSGYGTITYQGKSWSTHRLSYTLANGPIPEGKLLRHTCDNPICCNPSHLIPGTTLQNYQDLVERGDPPLPPLLTGDEHWSHKHPERVRRGDKANRVKLTENEVRELRRLREDGMSYAQLGEKFSITPQGAFRIVKRLVWSHVP